jgi:uncharacterized DUF497 family protein
VLENTEERPMWEGYEWDRSKAEVDVPKHGVTFFEGRTAFDDPFSITLADPDRSAEEQRFVLIGRTSRDRIVVVAHALRGENVRIISAGRADRDERRQYEEAEGS